MTKSNTTSTPSAPAEKSAHTPGPWHRATCNEGQAFAITADKGRICTINQTLGGLQGQQERNANARLIAAAPELLAACKAAVEVFSSYPRDPSEAKRMVLHVHAAIAKAERK
jgi:hypothetical protein